jgi:hypothetical protein
LSGNAAQLKWKSFAGERQWLPVHVLNVGKQNPITRDSGARDQRLQQRDCSTSRAASLSKFTCRRRIMQRGQDNFSAHSYLSRYIPITTIKDAMMNDARLVLERLCAEHGDDFAGLSRMLGRNAAYIQQYVRRGVPRRLGEEERRKLAHYFGVSEAILGGPGEIVSAPAGLISVNRHAVAVSAGPGAVASDELAKPYLAFDERWLKALTPSSPSDLSIVRVEGDSMSPTLNAGDDILVDLGDAGERLRDGIYVLRIDDALVVKRLALNPVGRRVTVQSDNPAYPDWPDCSLDEIKPIGRVIWSGRRIV